MNFRTVCYNRPSSASQTEKDSPFRQGREHPFFYGRPALGVAGFGGAAVGQFLTNAGFSPP